MNQVKFFLQIGVAGAVSGALALLAGFSVFQLLTASVVSLLCISAFTYILCRVYGGDESLREEITSVHAFFLSLVGGVALVGLVGSGGVKAAEILGVSTAFGVLLAIIMLLSYVALTAAFFLIAVRSRPVNARSAQASQMIRRLQRQAIPFR